RSQRGGHPEGGVRQPAGLLAAGEQLEGVAAGAEPERQRRHATGEGRVLSGHNRNPDRSATPRCVMEWKQFWKIVEAAYRPDGPEPGRRPRGRVLPPRRGRPGLAGEDRDEGLPRAARPGGEGTAAAAPGGRRLGLRGRGRDAEAVPPAVPPVPDPGGGRGGM